MITAFGSLDSAVGAIRAGAYDFVTKPFDVETLRLTLGARGPAPPIARRGQAAPAGRRRSVGLDQMIGSSAPHPEGQGSHRSRRRHRRGAARSPARAAPARSSSRARIHQRSRRSTGPFVAINCAAIPEALLESELFGHVKGAFTDARGPRQGLFLKANGGTLFLDEIGEMPLGMQPKLLRALQERTVRPVGGDVEIPYEARIVTASNRDLETEVAERRFREDLFYRINVLRIDVPRCVRAATTCCSWRSTSSSSSRSRRTRAWRDRRRRSRRSCWRTRGRETFASSRTASSERSRSRVSASSPSTICPRRSATTVHRSHRSRASSLTELMTMDEVERRYITRVLQAGRRQQDDRPRELLGLDRRTLYRKLERWGAPRAGAGQPTRRRRARGEQYDGERAAVSLFA